MHFTHAGDFFGGILGHPLLRPFAHDAEQRHLAVRHGHLDVRGVDVAMLEQGVADVLANPVVRALIATRATARVRPRAGAAARTLEPALRTPRGWIAPAPARLVVAIGRVALAAIAFVDVAAVARP